MTFRLFYADGTTLDIVADTPDGARAIAKTRRDGIITKVKVIGEKVHG